MTDHPYVEVALPVPLRQVFTYRRPEAPVELRERIVPGARVAVPFARRKAIGVVVRTRAEPPDGVKRIASVAGLLESDPIFPAELLSFLERAAAYYMAPLGEVLKSAAPALPRGALKRLKDDGFFADGSAPRGAAVKVREETFVRRTETQPQKRLGAAQQRVLALVEDRGEIGLTELRRHVPRAKAVVDALSRRLLLETDTREVLADRFFAAELPLSGQSPPEPTAAQSFAIDALVAALAEDAPAPFLLHGVTGSGKTEVYLRLIDEARRSGRGALLLVPEIALTPQLVGRFRARFGNEIAVLHSALKQKERDDYWRALRRGELRIAVGARSALFAPVPDLGVVVIDEEHDPSFKQEEGFRYHARDMAILRASRAGAVCVLGSATPSLESFHNANVGRYRLLSLPERATGQTMPEVELISLRTHRATTDAQRYVSAPLLKALRDCVERREQAILFLNRRGYSPTMQCGSCGELAGCPSCSVPLTEHRRERALRCHYCDYVETVSAPCRQCSALERVPLGLGTERLEDELARLLSPARIARLDRDTATGEGVEKVLDRLRNHEVDVLVGTQMVTKGHDIANVTLVGVLLADQSLGFPDFRASERTFQLIAQVAGRAGRGAKKGRVLVQTFQPDHPAIRLAAAHDYEGFYRAEVEAREELLYPPFGRVVAVRVNAIDDVEARGAIASLAQLAREQDAVREGRVSVLGPAPAPLAKLRNRHRHRFLVRSDDRRALRNLAAVLVGAAETARGKARISVDIDPVSMM